MRADRAALRETSRRGALRDRAAAWLSAGLIALGLLLAAPGALAQNAAANLDQPPWQEWDEVAAEARADIEARTLEPEDITNLREAFDAQRASALKASEAAAGEATRLEGELAALGSPPEEGAPAEAPATRTLRETLNRSLAAVKSIQGQAERARIRARDLVADLGAYQQRRFLDRLTQTSPSPVNPANWLSAVAYLRDVARTVTARAIDSAAEPIYRDFAISSGPLILGATIAALFIAFGFHGATLGFLLRRAYGSSQRRTRLLIGIGATAVRIVILLIAAIILLVGLLAIGVGGPVGEAALRGLARTVICMIAAYALAAALFSPSAAGLRLSQLTDWNARMGFAMTLLLGGAFALDLIARAAEEVDRPPPDARAVIVFVAVALGSFALWRLARIAKPLIEVERAKGEAALSLQIIGVLRRAALVVAIASPVLALLGYEFAARSLFFPAISSLAIISVVYLIFAVIGEGVDIYLTDTGGEEKGERLRLIPILVGFLLFCLTIPVLAVVWGASWADISGAYNTLAAGFTLGEVSLSPFDFVTFAIVFGVIYTATRMAQRLLKGSVLPKTKVDSGAADAIIAGVGYIGVFAGGFAAIAATGIDLSNIAIVAGALSVGIGFGLQNIVNNFVSGIILLVERPIKVGDWIEVGAAQGYVKQVNVRSTEIETFDRSTYILPNSDLISGAVHNWTHTDTVGRVITPVGVAHGTDPRRIEAILLDIAKEHPMIIASPAPVAFFLRFTSDALEFELRVFLRDINWMLVVMSDLNFRIEERFREEGIQFPYAQRDLHVRTLGPLEDMMREMKGGPRAEADPDASPPGRSPGPDAA